MPALPSRTSPSRRLIAVAVAAAFAAIPPATAAAAGSVSTDGQTIRVVEAAPGETNAVTVAIQTAGIIEISDFGTVVAGPGCTPSERDAQVALCPLGPGGVVVGTGGGDDTLGSYMASGLAPLPDGALRASLGDGNDTFHGGVMAEVVDGGPGNDTLDGRAGGDTLDGGAGDDKVSGEEGADTVRGGEGSDTLVGDPYSDRGIFPDTIDGGPGADTLEDYRNGNGGESTAPPISVSFDGVANDGRAGENDNVVGVEKVVPGSAGTFVGDDGPNEWRAPEVGLAGTYSGRGGNDVLRAGDSNGDAVDGGAGDDDVAGGLGDDTVIGGPGRDVIAGDRPLRCNEVHCDVGGGFGNDTIQARDGEVDSIACGPGNDRVVADADDVVAADCETVERPAAGGGPAPGPGPGPGPGRGGRSGGVAKPAVTVVGGARLRSVLRSGLTIRVKGVRAGAKLHATLQLAGPAARKLGLARGTRAVTVAGGDAKAGAAGTATLKLRFTKLASRRLARVKTVKLTLRASGAAARTLTLKR